MNVALRNQYNNELDAEALIPISANGLLYQKNIFDRLKFAFAVAPLRTHRAFRAVGINIKNVSELATIAEMSINNLDKKGVIMPDGKLYAFNVNDIVQKILSKHEPAAQSLLAKAPITWVP